MKFNSVSNADLIEKFKKLLSLEKLTTAEIVEYIKEIDRRRLYLEHGHTSLFSFLTKGLGYPPASAQRRIDSARLMEALPELKEDLKSGALNLTQVSMMAHSIRQKRREEPGAKFDKQDLLNKIKNHDVRETEKILAKELNLEIKVQEKTRIQSDESIRLEITLTKEEMEIFNRVKELISHTNPNPTWAEVMNYLAKDFVKRKDPLTKKPKSTSAAEAAPDQKSAMESEEARNKSDDERRTVKNPRTIPAAIKNAVFQRDQSCRWKCKHTGATCGSRFQMQIDHITPVWAGGGNEFENLQVLCSTHNQQKYRVECGAET